MFWVKVRAWIPQGNITTKNARLEVKQGRFTSEAQAAFKLTV